MAYYACDDCCGDGENFVWRWPYFDGWRIVWQWPGYVKCETCDGDGHFRPPTLPMWVRPPPPPPPPPKIYG
jgi:hypothetical protein